MNLRNLRYFLMVAEEKNMTKAARKLLFLNRLLAVSSADWRKNTIPVYLNENPACISQKQVFIWRNLLVKC